MQAAGSLYPHTQSLLTTISQFDVADTSETEQVEDNNQHPPQTTTDTDAQRIVELITTGEISLTSAKMICQIVKLFKSNTTDHLYFKRSCKALTLKPYGRLEHSVIIGPLEGTLHKTRSVFISTRNSLDLPSSQKILFKGAIRLEFNSHGRLTSSKKAVSKILKMSVKFDKLTESELFSFKKRLFIMQKLGHSHYYPENYAFLYKETSKTFSIYQEKAISDLFTRNEQNGGLFALSDEKKRSLARTLLGAAKHMKDAGVVHRDLKFENLLYFGEDDKHIDVKVSDFGLACLESDAYSLAKISGTLPWAAPELVRHAFELSTTPPNLGHKTDMWSTGLMIYFLAAGKPAPHQIPLFQLVEKERAMQAAVTDTPLFLNLMIEREILLTHWTSQIQAAEEPPKQLSTLKDLGVAMLHDSPEKRISVEKALEHI